MMQILKLLGTPKSFKNPRCRGDSLLERMRILKRFWNGVRQGPWEKWRSDGARARGFGNPIRPGPVGTGSLEAWQKEKRDPNDADDAGQGGQHHQHHWGSVSPFLASHAPNDPSLVLVISQPYPKRGLGASFQNDSAEMILENLPEMLYVRIPEATWQARSSLEQGVVPLRPRNVNWSLDGKGAMPMVRRGFTLQAPRTLSWAHPCHAAMDVGSLWQRPSYEGQLLGYMIASCVSHIEEMGVVQAYSPVLFPKETCPGRDCWCNSGVTNYCRPVIWRYGGETRNLRSQDIDCVAGRIPCV